MSAESYDQDPPVQNTNMQEIVINVKRDSFGDAQGSHVVSNETSSRFYGFRVDGQSGGKYGNAYGGFSGFSFGYEGNSEPGGLHGNFSAYLLEAHGGLRGGTRDNNIALDASGSIFLAEASGDAGFYTGKTGKYGAELGVEAGAYSAKGELKPSVSIFGIKMGVTIGGSFGSAHIGGRSAATFDSNNKNFEASGNAHVGFGAGLKIGFKFTNTEQAIHSSVRNKKK